MDAKTDPSSTVSTATAPTVIPCPKPVGAVVTAG
jgi:hypothetical protein